jgi:hypothetical protein
LQRTDTKNNDRSPQTIADGTNRYTIAPQKTAPDLAGPNFQHITVLASEEIFTFDTIL